MLGGRVCVSESQEETSLRLLYYSIEAFQLTEVCCTDVLSVLEEVGLLLVSSVTLLLKDFHLYSAKKQSHSCW